MPPANRDPDVSRTVTRAGTDPEPGPARPSERKESTRRRVLATLGAAGGALVAGCTGGADPGTTPGSAAVAGSAERTRSDGGATAAGRAGAATAGERTVGTRFGYAGARGESPPVEPDHTVSLEIRPREGVPIPEFYFEPTGLAVEVGDTVRFDLATPHHNVNAYHPAFGYTQRVPDGAPAYSSPVLAAGEYWLYTFRVGGVHDVMCSPHALFGMVGRIVVDTPTGPAAAPVGEAPGGERARSPELTAGRVLSDPALRPERIADRGAVSWSEIGEANKRPLLRPVEE